MRYGVRTAWSDALLIGILAAALGACRPAAEFAVVMQDSAMEPTYSARDLVNGRVFVDGKVLGA